MKREYKVIVGGLCLILLLSGIVFFGLYRYMDRQTEKDVREIARVFLREAAEQEDNRFEAIKAIRFTQMDSMKSELEDLGEDFNAASVHSALFRAAEFQNLANCTLVSPSGFMETVYGDAIEKLGDASFLMECLSDRQGRIVTGGWSAREQLIIYASPLRVPMKNGETSIGLLWCKPISLFASMINLEAPDSLVYFHIIRRDTSYVIKTDESWGSTYDELVLGHVVPEGMTAEEYVSRLHEAIASDDIFTMHTRYVDESEGVDIRRSVHAMPMEDSNWYLLSIIPYGVLDETITGMGSARSTRMLAALAILVVVLLAVFGMYLRMTRRQIVSLAEAKEAAETASAEAHRAQEEAEAAREDAEAANKAKSEFLSNMSHDIRTPMNAIVGMTAIATDHIDDKSRVRDCLKKITLSGKQLLCLINDVLDMSKIESGKMTLNPEALSLKQTMETMCDIVRPQIKANGQHFDIIILDIISEDVYCDSVRINQVLLNFLSNAMKFTPEGGDIHIELSQEESPKGSEYVRTHLTVRDTGMGMSEEFRRKLFTAFEREDNRRVQKTQGTGLGMTITKYIVDAMGGTIDVESEVGVGTTFHVTLDFEKVNVRPADMKLPDWKILVVDDNEELCRSAILSLTELGAQADSCLSGEEAVEKVLEQQKTGKGYYAILIDYKMDGMSGVETAMKIREIAGEELPISLISAYDWTDIEEEAKAAGITGFIPKPLFKSTLYHELKKYDCVSKHVEDAPHQADPVDLAGMRILLAEDNDINAEIASLILEESGCTVERADDGKIAAELFGTSREGWYDVILMDLRMPHMNGIEATQAIRSMTRADAAAIPIIAMTADAFAEDAQKCLSAGMNAHLAKPIDIEQLIKTLSRFRRNP